MTSLRVAFLIGVGGWALFTALFRIAGEYIFPNDVIVVALIVAMGPLLLFFVARPIFRFAGFEPAQYPLAAAAIVLPGMIADGFVLLNFRLILPNIDRSLDGAFAALLLFSYASILAAAIVFRGQRKEP